MSDVLVIITVKLLLKRDMRRQTRQTKNPNVTHQLTPHTQTIWLPQHTQASSKLLWITAFLCGLRRWSNKSSATDLKHISCDRNNLTRSVWHSRCYHADTKSRARWCTPFKTVCFHMVTVPEWHGFHGCNVSPSKAHIRMALSAASKGLWIPAPGGQLFFKHSCVAELRDEAWLCAGPGPVDQ